MMMATHFFCGDYDDEEEDNDDKINAIADDGNGADWQCGDIPWSDS